MSSSIPGQSFQQTYETNIQQIKSLDLFDFEGKTAEQIESDFMASSAAITNCLEPLHELFPVIKYVSTSFLLVYKYDVKRRKNHKRILLVKVTMKEFMVMILELRHVSHANNVGKDGRSIADRLKELFIVVGKDITKCTSDCNTYCEKNVLSRTLKAKGFEEKLVHWITVFENHRRKLETALAFHTSIGVDIANKKLDDVGERLGSTEEKMTQLLRKLDTPREREIIVFLDTHGGPRACLQNADLFEQLVVKSGETYASIAGSGDTVVRGSPELPNMVRRALIKELSEDIEKTFARNFVAFEKKLVMQEEKLSAAIAAETKQIIQTINSGAHDRIKDPDLREIWKEMGWKASVKARHFVMGLHDYYSDLYSKVRASSDAMTADLRISSPLVSPQLPSILLPGQEVVQYQPQSNDKWALAYINATYTQPILEAVDDDGTGMISIKEVNVFVTSRPEGWSLPHWIAYWAVGWQSSVTQYKNKIYSLVQTMFRTLEHVLPANRWIVDEYLAHETFWQIELLLRSTRSIKGNIAYDTNLSRITDSYASLEETMLREKLERFSYELDSPMTVSLITGGGRIERYIFPMIYLLLQHHMKVMLVACEHILDPREMHAHTRSFVSLFENVDYRIQNLEAIFKQSHLDIQGRLGNFAFGMFQLSYGDIKRSPILYSFPTFVAEHASEAPDSKEVTISSIQNQVASIPLTILKCGTQDGCTYTDSYEFETSPSTAHPLHGTWSGYMSRLDIDLGKDIVHIIRILFRVASDELNIRGRGETYQSVFSFEGQVHRDQAGYSFRFDTDDEDGFRQTASGALDINKGVITMAWLDEMGQDKSEEAYNEPFQLRRTPPTLLRHRYTAAELAEDSVRARWSYAFRAAYHVAQQKLWSFRFFHAKVMEKRRFVELSMRSTIASMGFSPRQPLSQMEALELEHLLRDLCPSEARFYQSLVDFEIKKIPVHQYLCDGCQCGIIRSRILCIQCMLDDQTDYIELCSSCIGKSPKKRGFVHDDSHPMLKVEEILHNFYFSQYVEKARELVNAYRETNREESHRLSRRFSLNSHYATTPLDALARSPVCSVCDDKLFTPYWACILCPRDSYYSCTDCAAERRIDLDHSTHKLSHPLVLLCRSKSDSEESCIEDRLTMMQQRFTEMEQSLQTSLRSIDTKFEERMSNVEHRISNVGHGISNVEHRLSNVEHRISDLERRWTAFEVNSDHRTNVMESLLRLLVAQTAGLSPSSLRASTPVFFGEDIASAAASSQRRNIGHAREQSFVEVLANGTSSSSLRSSPTISDPPRSRRPLPSAPSNKPNSRLS
ncbi:hypothetical protein CPC08DRAFT_767164 [Agrocybe pediades]|nr:hypothetical protein CPC08DRAFT_767164 [Agrocybe pediades]